MSEPESPDRVVAQPRFDVYFSYNSRDRALVEPIAARLKRAGLEPWLDRWALTPGGDWQRELGAGLDACIACAVFVGAHDIGAWELQEVTVAIDRATTQRGFRVFPVLLPGVDEPFDPNRLPHFLRARTWVDFRDPRNDRRALQHLINAVKGVPFGPDVTVVRGDDVAPYRGLRGFGEEDARFFFGRDREVQRLLEKLKSSPFLAVLGPSGSGKSSLVRAGLVPELRSGALVQEGDWHVCVLRPGATPLTALAAQLVGLSAGDGMQATLDALGRDPRTLHLSVELALADRPAGDRVLVIVDQLEEVFTLCNDEAQRQQLFATLMYATSQPGARTVVIVTMRADFYARCAAYPEFAQLITAQQMLIGPIDTDGLRQAIEEPARRVGLELEAGLSDTILADVAAEPGALPLLEHALLELWERRRGELLTLEGYREAGGVHGALAQRADKTFDGLSPDQREIARRALLRLTQPGEGTEDTRRRATRRELATAEGDVSFEMVLGRLVDARMLTTGRDETGQEVVDVSHEALIRGWPRLRRWIDADRAGLVTHRRLTDAAREWDALGREPAAFYRGARLAAAREWAADHADDLSPLEGEFLSASDAAERREIAAALRSSRRRRALAAGVAVMAAVFAAVVAFALTQRNDARQQARETAGLTMAESSTAVLGLRPDAAMLLGLAAYRTHPGVAERSSVLAGLTLVRQSGVRTILHGHAGSVHGVAISPDGRTLASAGGEGTIRLWDATTGRPRGAPLPGDGSSVNTLAFGPNGMLASGAADGNVRLWDLATGREVGHGMNAGSEVYGVAFGPHDTLASASARSGVQLWDGATGAALGRPLSSGGLGVLCVAFSGDGTLAAGTTSGWILVWNVAARRQLGRPLRADATAVNGVAFAPDGILASGGDDGTVHLWRLATRASVGDLATAPSGGSIDAVAFTGDGRTLAAGSIDGTARIWDVASRSLLGPPLAGQTDPVSGLVFSPDGNTLATASDDGTVWLWAVRGRRPLGAPLPVAAGNVQDVVFSPDGRTLAWGSADGKIRLWDLVHGRPLVAPLADAGSPVTSVAFSPSGQTLAAAAGGDSHIRLWDARTGKPLATLTGPAGGANGVTFSRDGRTLAAGGGALDGIGEVTLWDMPSGRPLTRLRSAGGAAVASVALSPDGRTVAAGRVDGTISLWDIRRGRLLGTLTGHPTTVLSVAFSPDGRTLASGSLDNSLRLWDVATRRQVNELNGPRGFVFSVAFSPDGRTLASANGDGTVRLWDAASGEPLGGVLTGNADFNSDGTSAGSVAFSPDGRTLASAGTGDTVRVWQDILWNDTNQLRSQACGLVSGGLSPTEWNRFGAGASFGETCP